ncbi:MAG: hypothetical protein U0997_06690 [Sulfurimicrobium sp.]|nr:hypothetical protein [Sulfurimicrobium sp.]
MNEKTELETLIPQPVEIEINGETLEIKPLTIGQLTRVMKALKPALADIQGEINLTMLAVDHGDTLLSAVAAATGMDAAWLDKLPTDDFIRLAGNLLEVNADFFTRRVLPEITAAVERIEKTTGVGLTLSTS